MFIDVESYVRPNPHHTLDGCYVNQALQMSTSLAVIVRVARQTPQFCLSLQGELPTWSLNLRMCAAGYTLGHTDAAFI